MKKTWLWLIEVSLLGISLSTQAIAESLHGEENVETPPGEIHSSPSSEIPHNNFRAVDANFAGRPLASKIADPKIDPAEATMTVTVIPGGIECPLVKDKYGKIYTLAAKLNDYHVGQELTFSASKAKRSICNEGTTLLIE